MNFVKVFSGILIALLSLSSVQAQEMSVSSPDNSISVVVSNAQEISYQVMYKDRTVLAPSHLGFEFKTEAAMDSNFTVLDHSISEVNETWAPVVRSKHATIQDHYKELHVVLEEKGEAKRKMDLFFRVYNDGVAFRYQLFRSETIGYRKITKEKTTFNIPNDPKAWIVEYGGYATSNEGEFMERKVSDIKQESLVAMPLLMDYGNDCWVAITEGNIENFGAFYIGSTGTDGELSTKLVPAFGEDEKGEKVRFQDDVLTPWRIVMIGDSPGTLIESEIIQNVNDPCAIADPSWIKPGKCAWDSWWSKGVNMQMPVIKEYIDLAAEMGWPYMLVDWKWYGEYKSPNADITKCAPQLDMEEIIAYAKAKNVEIILWLYSTDVNRNSAYKTAFPLYHEWGVAGVKIDFMDREDQEMVQWYHDIIKCAADNELLMNFHGAYKPDGIIRTYPNMLTREGVMGNEYHKFGRRMNAEHNVKLAYTRMLAGQMDYTPGGFNNVTTAEFKSQIPALVKNTRAAELSKFVIYESPLTIVCDHPDHIIGKKGADFLKIVPTEWDNTKFISGYPGDYIALARQSEEAWFVGVMNNSQAKTVTLDLDFLPQGKYEIELWADGKKANEVATDLKHEVKVINTAKPLKISLANNGGYVAVIKKK